MDWSFSNPLTDWHTLLLQTQTVTLTDLAQQVNALKSQVDSLQATNQLLSDGLTNQIEFLKQENQSITDSFSKYIDAMKWNLTALTGLAVILTAVGGWIFKRSLEDAKATAARIVHSELTNHIQPLIAAKANDIENTLRTEQIIGDTVVDYYIPGAVTSTLSEYNLLNSRGFSDVRRWDNNHRPQGRFGGVLVIDFVNCDALVVPLSPSGESKEEKETARQQRLQTMNNIVTETVQELMNLQIGYPIVVVYVRPGPGRLTAIDNLTKNFSQLKYYASANTPVSLMGAVVDSAYVAYGDRNLEV